MQLTLGEVISLATTFAGRSDFSSSEVSRLANLALLEVANRVYHKPKEATALSNVTGLGNERRITLPADYDGIMSLKFYSTSTDATTGNNVLGAETELTFADYSYLDSFSSTSGAPIRFTVYAGNIELDPIPDSRGSFVMRYLAKQGIMVLSSETPDIDERWQMGWLNKTEELVHRSRGNHQAADSAERRYINYMLATSNDKNTDEFAKGSMRLQLRRS